MNTEVATQKTPGEIMRTQVHAIEIADVLPEHITEEKFRRVAMTAINLTPALYDCDRKSLLGSLLNAATDGLLPDGREAALVLFGKQVVYMPMIGGIYKQLRNSGEISTLSSHVVYEADEFDYWIDENGEHMRHTPQLSNNRGPFKCVYAVCKLKDGSVEIEVMTKEEVDQVRSVSRSKGGPWNDWYPEMARKTVVRRLSKRLPMSSDQEDMMRRDDDLYDPEGEAPRRPQQADYQPEPPDQGDDFDQRFQDTMGDETGSERSKASEQGHKQEPEGHSDTSAPASPPTPAPSSEAVDSAGLTFVDGKHVWIFDNEGEAIGSYERAGNYFKAIKKLAKQTADPRGFLELNQRGANFFISQDEGLMDIWRGCWEIANQAGEAGGPS